MERTAKYPRLLTLAASALAIAALYWARGVLVPFVLAMLVSFLLAPLVLRLQRWRFSRVMAVVTAVLLVFVASSAAGWLVLGQAREVTAKLTEYKHNIRVKMDTLRGVLATPLKAATEAVSDLGSELAPTIEASAPGERPQPVRVVEPTREILEVVRQTVSPTIGVVLTAAITLLFAFVMLLRKDDLSDRLIRIIGQGEILVTTRALEEAASKVSSYLWRLLLLNSVHGLSVGIGLTCLGVPNALLWGLLSVLLRFIPYIGPWIAAAFPVLTVLAVSSGWWQPVLTVGLFALLELSSNCLLEPWIYGRGTGISPLAVLVSAMFWTWIWGPVGLVLSTPLTVCLVVMGKYVPQVKFLQLIFGDAPGLLPAARLYQRLIAGEQDEVWSVLRGELEQRSLAAVYDSVVLPALSMAELDRRSGALDEAAQTRIEDTLELLLEEAGELHTEAGTGTASTLAPALVDPVRVCCLPARGQLDAMAATMLRQVLEREGLQVEVLSNHELLGETLDLMKSRRVEVLCISAVPPSRFLHVGYLCKKIAARFPGLPIVAGMWTVDLGTQAAAERLPVMTGVHVVISLETALSQVQQTAQLVRLQRAADPPAVLAATG